MTTAQEILKKDIENINDDIVIEKIRIFIMGMLAQQHISERQSDSPKQLAKAICVSTSVDALS